MGDMRATVRKGPPCITGQMMDRLAPDVRADILDAMTDPLCTSAAIAAELSERVGVVVHAQSVNRHRRTVNGRVDGCACRG